MVDWNVEDCCDAKGIPRRSPCMRFCRHDNDGQQGHNDRSLISMCEGKYMPIAETCRKNNQSHLGIYELELHYFYSIHILSWLFEFLLLFQSALSFPNRSA